MAGFRLVGLLAALRPGIDAAGLTAAAGALLDPLAGPVALGSPWAPDNHLARIVIDDILGVRPPAPPTRAEAIRVPAVARARGVVCTTIARIELGAYRGDTRLDAASEPSWLHATDGPVSPFHRMLHTMDDLLFYGWSCWTVTDRQLVDGAPVGFPLRMTRLAPLSEWRFEPDTGRVLRPTPAGGWRPVNAREVVLIPGPHEGLLTEGAPAVAHARDLQRSAHNAARFPSSYLGLKQAPNAAPVKRRSDNPDEVTVETLLRDWRQARLNPDGGGVAWLGGVDAVEMGSYAEHLLTAGRNAADVDVARHSYVPADLIDASVPESSLHYSTSRDNDRRAIDYGLGAYMSAFSGRMTQDDVTPRGQRIAFDLEQWLRGAAPMPGQAPTEQTPGMTPDGQETPA